MFAFISRRRSAVALGAAAVLAVGIAAQTPASATDHNAPGAASADLLPYQDPTLPVSERVADLLARMTLAEKIGQMSYDPLYPFGWGLTTK